MSLKADKRIRKIPGGVRVLSYAKLNLYLEILDKRPDGYHNLETIFERVSLADEIVIKRAPGNSIKIETDSPDIPKGSGNLAYQAAEFLKKNFGIFAGLVIKIKKPHHCPGARHTLLILQRLNLNSRGNLILKECWRHYLNRRLNPRLPECAFLS